jgi:hypothetical protein
MLTVRYSAVDGAQITRKFKTPEGARKFAVRYVGETPEFGSRYAVSFDGVGKVTVEGCTVAELFAGPVKPEMVPLHSEDCDAPTEYALKSECEEIVVDADSDEWGTHLHYGWARKTDLARWKAEHEARLAADLYADDIPF